MNLKFLNIILFLILFQFVRAQTLNLKFTHITTKEGLSTDFVSSVCQDYKGFMWFATFDGLNMYDGYDFKLFTYNKNDTSSIASNAILKIKEDSKGRLWIATNNGIDIFDRNLISFKHIPFIQEGNILFYENLVRDIFEDSMGNIFVTNGSEIYKYDSIAHGFKEFLIGVKDFEKIKREGIWTILIDKSNRLWIGSTSFSLYVYDLSNNKVIASPEYKENLDINKMIFKVAEDADGDILLGTDNGITYIKSDLSEKRDLKLPQVTVNPNSEIVFDIYTDSKNRTWVGTNTYGLILFNKKEFSLTPYFSNSYDNYSLMDFSIISICEDREGNLWFGTNRGGVNYVEISYGSKFKHYKHEANDPNSLIHDVVSAIFEDSENNLWLGTDGGGLDFIDAKTQNHTYYRNEKDNPNSITRNSVLAITEDQNNNIWLGGYLLGVNVINKKTGMITRYLHDPDDANSLCHDDVRDIFCESDSVVWIATNGGGLDKFNPKTTTFTHYKEGGENSIISNYCIKFFKDSYDNLWIGTYGGISILDLKNNIFTNYIKSNAPGSISNNWVYAFAEDSMGNIWVGTSIGLNYFNRLNKDFTAYFLAEGLPNDIINGILIDNSNNLWLSTNKGISKFNPVTGKVKNFDLVDGLQGDQFIHGSYYKSKSGKMYFGGLNGYNSFFPDSIKVNKYEPSVYITDLLIFYKTVQLNDKNSPLTKSITETDKITLSYNQSVITFRYTALNFQNPEKNQYAYQLVGFDKGWNYVGARREATFTNLDPGSYLFKVKASNNDGTWNEKSTSIVVNILPPWWKTIVFKILFILIVISIIFCFYFYRVNELKKQKINLEKLVKLRTSEIEKNNAQLEERQIKIEEQAEELKSQKEELENTNKHLTDLNSTKDKFFSIIAHDLKSPFSVIYGYTEILHKEKDILEKEDRDKYIDSVYQSSKRLFILLENLLQWAMTQTNQIIFKPQKFTFKELIDDIIILQKENILTKEIKLISNIDSSINIVADYNMIHVVLRNLLNNAIKFTAPGGQISMEIHKTNNILEFSIQDTGTGIKKEELDRLFHIEKNSTSPGTNGEQGTGLGLILCKEFIEKHGGTIWAESEFGQGSTFKFTLPIK
ncbi:MAG: ATP-binding protein [Bacteroidales bacterium]|nr:ATP-binding protein [Bacteroidales bacterium]